MQKNILLENRKFYRGTIFTISYFWDKKECDSFLLAECWDENYIFQIVCISGYNAGTVLGYIKKGTLSGTHRAITYEELIDGIKENFMNPDLESLKIEDEYKPRFE